MSFNILSDGRFVCYFKGTIYDLNVDTRIPKSKIRLEADITPTFFFNT